MSLWHAAKTYSIEALDCQIAQIKLALFGYGFE